MLRRGRGAMPGWFCDRRQRQWVGPARQRVRIEVGNRRGGRVGHIVGQCGPVDRRGCGQGSRTQPAKEFTARKTGSDLRGFQVEGRSFSEHTVEVCNLCKFTKNRAPPKRNTGCLSW